MKPKIWRQKMVRALAISEDRRNQELAEKLSACRDREGQRCNLAMCQLCVAELRNPIFNAFWEYGISYAQGLLPGSYWSEAVPGESYPIGQLNQMDLRSINQKIRNECWDAGYPLVVAATDISLVDDHARQGPPFWQASVFGYALGLPLFFMCSPGAKKTKQWLDRTEMPLNVYLPKTIRDEFKSKVCAETHEGTREPRMRAAQFRELAQYLAGHEMEERCFLIGCNFSKGRIRPNHGVRKWLKSRGMRKLLKIFAEFNG
jgi:hypothetical protein